MMHNTTCVTLSESVWDCRVDSTVLGEDIAVNVCLGTSLVFVMADGWFKHQQELLLFCRVSSCLKSRTRCSLFVQSYKLFLAEDPSSPTCVIAGPVPNHAECIQVMGFAVAAASAAHGWGSSQWVCLLRVARLCSSLQPLNDCSQHPLVNMQEQVSRDAKAFSPIIGN